jgi:hypothetical protein
MSDDLEMRRAKLTAIPDEREESSVRRGDGGPTACRTDLSLVLDLVAEYISSFVVLDQVQRDELALFVMHSHAIDAADATPYQAINSAEKESGKTQLLETLELVVARPWLTGRVTAAVLARKVDAEKPTLLLDESDAAFKGEKEYAEALRGILNTGYRRGGKASICVGQGAGITYADLSTFGPKAIAGLESLPDTVASRSIVIRLKRKRRGEQVKRFRRREVQALAEPLYQALASLGEHHVDHLAAARPELPDELTDRQQDVWEPLLAIADTAGASWPERARRAALELSRRAEAADDSLGVHLLADCQRAFGATVDKLATKELISLLSEDEEAPWGTWHRGARISPRSLARLLTPFGLRSRNLRLDDEVVKGYLREQFEEAWDRYLPPHPPFYPLHPLQPASALGKPPDFYPLHDPNVADSKQASIPHEQTDVADVADRGGNRASPSVSEPAELAVGLTVNPTPDTPDQEDAEQDESTESLPPDARRSGVSGVPLTVGVTNSDGDPSTRSGVSGVASTVGVGNPDGNGPLREQDAAAFVDEQAELFGGRLEDLRRAAEEGRLR